MDIEELIERGETQSVEFKESLRLKEERGLAIEGDAEIYDILTQLNLLQDTKLANAAILLFGKDPERFFMLKKDILIASGKGKRTYYMLRGFYIKAGRHVEI